METKFFKKAIKILSKIDQPTILKVDTTQLYLVQATPQAIEALHDAGYTTALGCGVLQVLQPSRCPQKARLGRMPRA